MERMSSANEPSPLRIQPQTSGWRTIKPAVSVMAFIFGVLIAASGINAFVFQSYYVEGTSMQPTLHDDDRLIVGKANQVLADLQGERFVPDRGDIVVLTSDLADDTGLPGERERLIKRVIGLPGERILIRGGTVTIFNNEHPGGFNPDAALGLQLEPTFSPNPISVRLGRDEVFVIGDNRGPGGSFDSRSFGPVKLERVKGSLWVRVFPLSHVKLF